MRRDYSSAIAEAEKQGVDFSKDFFAQPSSVGSLCAELARKHGYRKPRLANGSTGRYFYARMQRDLERMQRDLERMSNAERAARIRVHHVGTKGGNFPK